MLTAPNLLTLARAGSAALLAASVAAPANRNLRRAAFASLLLGVTAVDWLDGPLARRIGPTPLGAVLDLEADSWLTFWAAAAGYRGGRLKGWVLLPAALRYPLRLARPAYPGNLAWQRAAGVGQMVVLVAALSPSRAAARAARELAPVAVAAQLAALGRDAFSATIRSGS